MKPYPEMKDSGGSWIGKVPAGWKIIKLKKVVTLSGEKTATQKSPYIGMENIVSWNGTYKLNTQIIPESICSVFHSGDILFGKLRPYLAKCVLMDLDGVCSGELLVLTNIKCNKSFLRYFLLNKYFIDVVNSSTYGAKMPRANWDFIGNQLIVLPPSDEQAQIVRYLDSMTAKIDKLIRARKQQIELLKEQKQAVINQAVTRGLNPNVELKDSGLDWLGPIPKHWECAKIRELFIERVQKVSDKEYAPLSVSKGGIVPQIATVAKSDNSDNRKLVKQGDFVINSRSDRKSSSGISNYDGSVSLINIVLKPRMQKSGRFFHYLLKSVSFVEEYYRNGRGIVADLWTTRYSEMKSILLPLPPLDEQAQIVRYLDSMTAKINKLIRAWEEQIAVLEEQKQALISAVVTGQVDVRNIAVNAVSPDELAASGDPEEAEESDSPIPEECEAL